MKRMMIAMLVVLLLIGICVGCAANNQPGESAQTPIPKDILDEDVDAMGQEIEAVHAETQRIISTAPSVTEILFALGCGESIVGVDIGSTYPDETASIEVVGDYNGFDVEKVIALTPTVVFAGNTLQREQIQILKDAGINVVAVEPTYYEDIASSITLIGKVVGKQAEAAALNEQIAKVESAVKEKAAQFKSKPSVYYVMTFGDGGNWTSGEGSFINTLIEMAGGVPVTAGTASEWLDYPIEDLVNKDPDILILPHWVNEAELAEATGYSKLTAVQNGHYFFIDADIIERPSPRITEALIKLQEGIQKFLAGE